ncbi:VOC family protein [Paraburkholderia phosphatilytica]|uniref:VOC family protein n=1 Tax=Paraburkholderia phosphatilytica TaxID=2282883 RepID=UPI000E4E5570|nr:VOC family protein [Paraburkholderia phosphatilytica]
MNPDSLTSGIDHLGLTVRNIEVTSAFFIECLGWKKVGEKPDYPAVFVSDGRIMLTLWQLKNAEPGSEFDRRSHIGLHHVALRAKDERAFDEILQRVSNWPGVKVEFPPELLGQGPKRHMMIYEPGGIRVEFDVVPG